MHIKSQNIKAMKKNFETITLARSSLNQTRKMSPREDNRTNLEAPPENSLNWPWRVSGQDPNEETQQAEERWAQKEPRHNTPVSPEGRQSVCKGYLFIINIS